MTSSTLSPGQTIGVMAPSSYIEKTDIERSKTALEERGYKVVIHPQTYARHHQSAGQVQEKLEALHSLYTNNEIDAIWAAGGGNRSLYILDGLDYNLISKNPKPLIGFSDVTAPLNAIYARADVTGWHAQVFKHLHNFDQLDDTLSVLSGEKNSFPLQNANILQQGQCKGPLIGGCLSLFHYLSGTDDCPNLQNAILFLEDTGDEMSRFDRMFAHMKRVGVFEKIGGLVLGEFHNIKDSALPFGFSFEDILAECLDGRTIPVVTNAPFGHGSNLYPLRVGAQAELNMTNSDSNLYFL